MTTRSFTKEEAEEFQRKLKQAREEDLANGWDPDAPEEGEGIDPMTDNLVIILKKKKVMAKGRC